MNRNLFCWIAVLLVAAAGCGKSKPGVRAAEGARVTNVAVYPVRPDSLTRHSLLPATAQAWREVTLSAQESGICVEVRKDLGDRVRRGEVLARQNTDLLEAAAVEAEANLKLQNYNFKHAEELYREGSISEQSYRMAAYDLRRAESGLQTLRQRIEHAHIRAPFSGKIARRMVEVGQMVPAGGPVFHLVQTDSTRLDVWVPENEISDFREGGSAEVVFDADPGRVFRGTIVRIGPAADADRRVFPMEVYLPNPEGRVRPGMMGRMKAVRRTYRDAVVIPREAVLERETGPVAFVAADSLARLCNLELGASEGDRVLVRKGLSFGDRVIVRGGRDLIDGDRVQITERLDP